MNLPDRLARALAGMLGDRWPPIGVAVSGGGDSMALMDLLRRTGTDIRIVSVNHNLRTEAAGEIALVAAYCARHGLDHDVLDWHWDGQSSLQAAARDGRRALIGAWARGRGLAHVALGHTADDQAETVLMRLARGSGVDGLAAMTPVSSRDGITWLRPLLDERRDTLRAWLEAEELPWADDPSNEDDAYDRVKARKALAALEPLGLSVARLTATAAHMARARTALEAGMAALARDAVTVDGGDLVIDRAMLEAAPEELRTRLMARGLAWVAGQDYPPRYGALTRALGAGSAQTLHGCLILPGAATLRLTREPAAVAGTRCPVETPWDGRWVLIGPAEPGHEVRALGAGGLALCPDWRATRRPRRALFSSPSVWRDKELISAPLAGLSRGWRAELLPNRANFP